MTGSTRTCVTHLDLTRISIHVRKKIFKCVVLAVLCYYDDFRVIYHRRDDLIVCITEVAKSHDSLCSKAFSCEKNCVSIWNSIKSCLTSNRS